MRLPGDIHITGNTLHPRLDPATAPRRTRVIAGLCHELTATQTRYPGTDLTIKYSIKGFETAQRRGGASGAAGAHDATEMRSHYVGSPEPPNCDGTVGLS